MRTRAMEAWSSSAILTEKAGKGVSLLYGYWFLTRRGG